MNSSFECFFDMVNRNIWKGVHRLIHYMIDSMSQTLGDLREEGGISQILNIKKSHINTFPLSFLLLTLFSPFRIIYLLSRLKSAWNIGKNSYKINTLELKITHMIYWLQILLI